MMGLQRRCVLVVTSQYKYGDKWPYSHTKIVCKYPGGPVKYDFVHMLNQAFSKQPLNEFCSLPKNDP